MSLSSLNQIALFLELYNFYFATIEEKEKYQALNRGGPQNKD